jgi:hypothetical protein
MRHSFQVFEDRAAALEKKAPVESVHVDGAAVTFVQGTDRCPANTAHLCKTVLELLGVRCTSANFGADRAQAIQIGGPK